MSQLFNQRNWDLLWFKIGAQVPPHFSVVQRPYAQEHRHYHTSVHINACLQHLQDHAYLAKNSEAVEYALWMHDLVYDTHRSDNEAQSAQQALHWLKQTQATLDAALVEAMIMATQHHDSREADDIGLVCDFDLSVLALEPAHYADYVKAIRMEYAWVPEPLFRESRQRFIRTLLEQPAIYRHARLKSLWEDKARDNLSRELMD